MKGADISSKSPSQMLQPISAEQAFAQIPSIKEPRIVGEWVLWLEQRPEESGRMTVLIRPWGHPECSPKELTPFPINLRSRIHGYGGGVLASAYRANELVLAWIDDLDACLWTQTFTEFSNPLENYSEKFVYIYRPQQFVRIIILKKLLQKKLL